MLQTSTSTNLRNSAMRHFSVRTSLSWTKFSNTFLSNHAACYHRTKTDTVLLPQVYHRKKIALWWKRIWWKLFMKMLKLDMWPIALWVTVPEYAIHAAGSQFSFVFIFTGKEKEKKTICWCTLYVGYAHFWSQRLPSTFDSSIAYTNWFVSTWRPVSHGFSTPLIKIAKGRRGIKNRNVFEWFLWFQCDSELK